MITHLNIKNFAIIDEVDLDFHEGLNIITGETGSGKSIIIQAINLALGGRGSASYVSKGKNKAVIQMIIEADFYAVAGLAEEKGIDLKDSKELIISREINASGKTICRVNGSIVHLSDLSQICSRLVDVHGQYDNQSLLNPANHIKLVDSYNETEIRPIKKKLYDAYSRYAAVLKKISAFKQDQSDRIRRQDFITYEWNEIQSANLQIDEDILLSQRLSILQNSEKIYENISRCYDLLYSNPLSKAEQYISSIAEYDPRYGAFAETISQCSYAIEDLCTELRQEKDRVTFSPDEIDQTIARLDLLDNLKRKYGNSIEKILEYRDSLASQKEQLENSEETQAKLKEELSIVEKETSKLSSELTELRKKYAAEIEKKVQNELRDLNFKNAIFRIEFGENKTERGRPAFSPEGIDTVEFMFSANKGESLLPLAAAASGGEISRVMLAFKRIVGEFDRIPTMIFDEIDTGISGITASIVGKKLSQIASKHQVLCITHLPQIAAMGEHHYKISKEETEDRVHTTVTELSHKEKILEIARLLGGINITENTLESAREMLEKNN